VPDDLILVTCLACRRVVEIRLHPTLRTERILNLFFSVREAVQNALDEVLSADHFPELRRGVVQTSSPDGPGLHYRRLDGTCCSAKALGRIRREWNDRNPHFPWPSEAGQGRDVPTLSLNPEANAEWNRVLAEQLLQSIVAAGEDGRSKSELMNPVRGRTHVLAKDRDLAVNALLDLGVIVLEVQLVGNHGSAQRTVYRARRNS